MKRMITLASVATMALLPVPVSAQCPEKMWQCSAEMMERYDSPDQSGRAVIITFPQIGRVKITPRISDTRNGFWCTAEVRNRASRVVLKTIGGLGQFGGRCGATSSVGKVPGPPNVYRVAIIHIATAPGESILEVGRYTPVIIFRTLRDPVWRVDADLARELVAAGATDTIADIRNFLRRTKR